MAKATTAAEEIVHFDESPTCITTSSPRLGATMCIGASSRTVD